MTKNGVLRRYFWRLRKWTRYATGRSLHNVPQGIGKAYRENQLRGYFNDLTGKTKWCGPLDSAGIPIVQTDSGRRFSFPITVFQKGLGHWDCYLLSAESSSDERDKFLAIADWAVRTLDQKGGWPCWDQLNRGTTTPYSSMAQGEGLSILARAYQLTYQESYRCAAFIAKDAMVNSRSGLGVARQTPEGLVLEEYPGSRMPAVLNGWVFSLMGLHDFELAFPGSATQALLEDCLSAFVATLPRYDTGYWSMYDLGGTIASPFYHRLHIVQLKTMARTFEKHEHTLMQFARCWETFETSKLKHTRALLLKIGQKLRDTENEEFS